MKNDSVKSEGQSACMALLLGVLVLVVGVIASALLNGCTPQRPAIALPPPCDTLTLVSITADCRVSVLAHCERDTKDQPLESCPALKACDARIDQWLACKGQSTTQGTAQVSQ